MGTFQNTVQERTEQFAQIGARHGAGHRPARHLHLVLPGAQLDSHTFTFDAATAYTVSVDGILAFSAAAAEFADLNALVDGAIAALNAHPQVSQIVAADLLSAGVMRLRAREPGNAFTSARTVVGGGGTNTITTPTANVTGANAEAGDSMFRAAAATNARLVGAPSAFDDVFQGLVQFRHRGAELEDTPNQFAYPAGSQVPVDPNGSHIVAPETQVQPGDRVFARFQGVGTAGALSNGSGQAAQVERVTANAATNDKLYSLILRKLQTPARTDLIEFTADASATVTEVRDGLIARINALPVPYTAAVGAGADDLDITADVALDSFIVEDVDAELDITNQVAYDLIRIENAQWLTSTAPGNKGHVTYEVA